MRKGQATALIAMAIGMATAAATPAQVQAQMVASAAPASVADALRARGYQAELIKGSDGDPLIRSASGGAKFTILFLGCTGGKGCTTIQFYAGFKSNGSISVGKMNEWNRTKRFARGYIDGDGDPCLEMDVDLDVGGMPRALFDDHMEVWTAVLDSFRTFIK